MSGNAADPKMVEKSRLRETFDGRHFIADFKALLDSPSGRRVIWWLLGECGMYRSSFTGNSTTFFNEGERNIALKLHAKIVEASPESLILMMQESKKREETHADASS